MRQNMGSIVTAAAITGTPLRVAGIRTTDIVWSTLQEVLGTLDSHYGIHLEYTLQWCAYPDPLDQKMLVGDKHQPARIIRLEDVHQAEYVDIVVGEIELDADLKAGRNPAVHSSAHQLLEFTTTRRPPISIAEMHGTMPNKAFAHVIERCNPHGLLAHRLTYNTDNYGTCFTRVTTVLIIMRHSDTGLDQTDATFEMPQCFQDFDDTMTSLRTAPVGPERFLLGTSAVEQATYNMFSAAAAAAVIRDVRTTLIYEDTSASGKRKATDQLKQADWEAIHIDAFTTAQISWPPGPEWFEAVAGSGVVVDQSRMCEAAHYYGHRPDASMAVSYHDLSISLLHPRSFVGAFPPVNSNSVVLQLGERPKIVMPQEVLAMHGFEYSRFDELPMEDLGCFSKLSRVASVTCNGYGLGAAFYAMFASAAPLGTALMAERVQQRDAGV